MTSFKSKQELPRVEEQLIQLLDEYEKNNGSILLINGRDYRCSVTEQWTFYEEQKENEKLQRVNIFNSSNQHFINYIK